MSFSQGGLPPGKKRKESEDSMNAITEHNSQVGNDNTIDYDLQSGVMQCGPCQRMAPLFQQLAAKYPKASFLKVDVDHCQDTAAAQGVSAMPTFIFYRNKVKIDRLQGADPNGLENKIKQHVGADEGEEPEVVAGHVFLLAVLVRTFFTASLYDGLVPRLI
ncbi:unnamed protein product [Acanthoscelides obtectus]|uniref:Thioredoxin domain-containing protein n=1 Tax=Acanthoscelides obtectus TaxID=200917 RepID=A0A9P0JPR8_ACAOB|nr:unnamed protein product [Acanthoscelides obtectus]CAK1641433.1 Thioredoxin-like protein 1 [Acanthoscelides obtectus]